MADHELDRADLWRLKGEGNANWVFAYAGSLPHLVGKVLRVRKPQAYCAPEHVALENEVWGPMLGCITADSGNGATSAAVAREQRYVQQVLAPLLGPQHIPSQQPVAPSASFLQQLLAASGCLPKIEGGNAGSSSASSGGSSAAGPATLMPDVTLLPGSRPTCADAATAAAASPSSQPAPGSSGSGAGPGVCIELKPKCGFISGCGTVHPDNRPLKHSRSRYQLHQTLKLAQGSIAACSAYDPCDLFSGEPGRLRRALAALLAHPQNNLLLFLDGQQQPGEQQLGATAGQPGKQQQPGEQPGEEPADGQQQGTVQEQAAQPAGDELLGALLPLLPPGERRGALVELLAAALEADGVLPRLLQAQQQCRYDIEGVYRLYCRLAGLPPAADAAAEDASTASGACSEDASSHAAAVRQLMALPAEEARAVLRSYVVAATAKDCAIMVTLQRLETAPLPADGPAAAAAAASGGGPGSCTSPHQQQQVALQEQPGCIAVPARGGAWFRYRLCFVDLDLKPLAKIPQHWQLDRRILAAVQEHLSSDHDSSVMPPS